MKSRFIPKNMLFGSDFEVFIKKRNSGQIIPPAVIFKDKLASLVGSKENPVYYNHFKSEGLTIEYGVQIDCCTLEFTVKPSKSFGSLRDRIKSILTETYTFTHLDKIFNDIRLEAYSISNRAVVEVTEELLVDEVSNTFGCSEEFNVYHPGIAIKSQPNSNFPNIRTAGFHIHFGYDDAQSPEGRAFGRRLVIALDFVRSLSFQELDYELLNNRKIRRSSLYSNYGSYREKPYGIEYRALEYREFMKHEFPMHLQSAVYLATYYSDYFDDSDPKILNYFKEYFSIFYNTESSAMYTMTKDVLGVTNKDRYKSKGIAKIYSAFASNYKLEKQKQK